MKRIVLIACLLSGFGISAQEKQKDILYVEKVNSILSLRPYTNQHIDLLMLDYPKSETSPLLYRPATGLNIGGEIAFSFLSFNYQQNLPLLQPDVPDYLKPSHQRIGFNMGGKIFGMEMTFQKNKGFYLMNPDAYPAVNDIQLDDAQYRPDLTSTTFGLDFRFTFSNKLSANALFDQSERQLRSKGAFTIIVGNRFHDFHSSTPFVPWLSRSDYEISGTVDELWVNTIHVMPGYGYIAAAGKWNIGLFLYSGSGLQLRKYVNNLESKLGVRFPMALKGKAGIAYQGKYLYSRLTANGDLVSLGMKDANFKWLQSFWEFSIGLRFYGNKDK